MKVVITNQGQYDLKLLVRKSADETGTDGTGGDNGLVDVIVPVGESFTMEEGWQLGRMAELTPTGEGNGFDAMYYGGAN